MPLEVSHALRALDVCLVAILPWLAAWIVASGLDDLFVDLAYWRMRRAKKRPLPKERRPSRRLRNIAIFIPCWQEHAVIERMIRHNLSVVNYSRFTIFLGAYPNDRDTLAALCRLEESDPRLRACPCPHDGPTSKADCLNWIYQHMLVYERESGEFFDALVTHDAEDVIHPDSLAAFDRHLDDYDMVQIPVLPLATPLSQWVHGIYCDEFAESQSKDLPARVFAGGFMPSCGVGTGLSRDTVERLAVANANRVFEPACLTEDYELGLRVHRLGLRQIFTGTAVSTREFFPQNFRGAVRQRTRWITGIALQGWQRNGWGRTGKERYWLWRDRKGLLGNPLSVVANLGFLYGFTTWTVAQAMGTTWAIGANLTSAGVVLAWTGLAMQCIRTGIRAAWCARFYGPGFAAGAPLRVFVANAINFVATLRAVKHFAESVITRTPLVWLKTEHSFPSEVMLGRPRATERKSRAAGVP